MKKTYSSALFSFTVTITIFLIIKDKILSSFLPNSWVGIIIEILLGVGLYALIFEVAYRMVLGYERRISPYSQLGGDWCQIFTFTNTHGTQIRSGPAKIEHIDDNLKISATSYRLTGSGFNNFSSSWQSTAVILNHQKITLLFESEGERATTRGTMVFTLEGTPVNKLVGNFNDNAPSVNYGNITLFKNKNDFLKELEELEKIGVCV